jgi:BirA family transcriptional regulator, biotin operon repressor / biotin---[acetyl-CoA-carboxylase] ligase
MTIGSKVYRTHTTSDSMAWAKEHLSTAPDGSIFLADILTQAHGRQGRTWQIHPGQLIVTFILKPPVLATLHHEDLHIRLSQLNMAITLGILDPLKQFKTRLKWPNDFIINNKKIGGTLMQLVWHGSIPQGIIIGFALNINNEFEQTDPLYSIATSVKMTTQAEHDRRTLYKKMLDSLNAWYQSWQHERFMDIYRQWKEEQACLGQPITIHQKDGSLIEGVAQQVLPNGDLLVTDKHKKQKTISFYQVEEVK